MPLVNRTRSGDENEDEDDGRRRQETNCGGDLLRSRWHNVPKSIQRPPPFRAAENRQRDRRERQWIGHDSARVFALPLRLAHSNVARNGALSWIAANGRAEQASRGGGRAKSKPPRAGKFFVARSRATRLGKRGFRVATELAGGGEKICRRTPGLFSEPAPVQTINHFDGNNLAERLQRPRGLGVCAAVSFAAQTHRLGRWGQAETRARGERENHLVLPGGEFRRRLAQQFKFEIWRFEISNRKAPGSANLLFRHRC